MFLQAMVLRVTTVCLLPVAAVEPSPSKPAESAVAKLRAEAKTLAPLVTSPAVKTFLEATDRLPRVQGRPVYRDQGRRTAYTQSEFDRLPTEEQAKLERRDLDEDFYYFTSYGSPLVYARPLDLIAAKAGWGSFQGKRILDFGYGTVGHLRMLASLGADAVGVDVHPLLRVLYSQPEDQGAIAGADGVAGQLRLVDGHFPGDPPVREAIGGGYDLIISKNTLKRGYIHPQREVDERFLVKLGVDDEAFVRALFDCLKPSGLVMIYNIAPAQNPPDKPYLAHADGRCPFDTDLLKRVGFEVVAYDMDDQDAILGFWYALGYDEGKTRTDLAADLFVHYTLLRRP